MNLLYATEKIYLAEKSQLDSIGGGFCTCSTAAATAEKTASLSNFTLKTGAQVSVKFTYANTASSPTLNINGTGAKSIYYHNSAVPAAMLMSGGVYLFVYDGSRWQLLGNHFAGSDNNTLGAMQFFQKLSSSYYSGEQLSIDTDYFSFPTTATNDNTHTTCYGKINFGEFAKQGYKRLYFNFCETENCSLQINIYISTTSSSSNAVASTECTISKTTYSGDHYATCLLDISSLTGSYYFIVTFKKINGFTYSLTAKDVYLLT